MDHSAQKKELKERLRQYNETDLRWSYVIIAGMCVVGAVVNLFLPHGWVIWPAVLAVGIMVLINEATSRNAQGLPPLLVYGWVFAALLIWVAMAVVFSAIFPILLYVGLPLMLGYGIFAYVKNRKRQHLAADRRAKGLCIHCAQPIELGAAQCLHCGKDSTPSQLSLFKRFQAGNRTAQDVERTRDLLTPKPPTVAAKRKEEALLNKRPQSPSSKPKPS
jgi:hypothetical protein